MLKQIINEIKEGKYKDDIHIWSSLIIRELTEKDDNLAVQWVSNTISQK